jgi:hypothetical protein
MDRSHFGTPKLSGPGRAFNVLLRTELDGLRPHLQQQMQLLVRRRVVWIAMRPTREGGLPLC